MFLRICVAITIKCPQIFSLPIAMWRIFDKNEGPMTSPNLSKYLWKSCSISIFPHFIRDLCNAMEKSCDLSVSPSPFVLDFGTWDFELWLFNFFLKIMLAKKKEVLMNYAVTKVKKKKVLFSCISFFCILHSLLLFCKLSNSR